jgi:hypothetical protein
MSDHEPRALDALRGIDGPADLDDDVAARIEAEMLARFDDCVESGPSQDGGSETVVVLDDARGRPGRTRSRRVTRAISAAAAVLAIVTGIVLASTREEPAPADPPPSTVAPVDERAVEEQLRTFCAASIDPLGAAADRWEPDGQPSEVQNDVITEAERAVLAMSGLAPPLGDRLAFAAEAATVAVTDARMAVNLGAGGPDVDQAVLDAVDAVFGSLAASGVSPLPASCSR